MILMCVCAREGWQALTAGWMTCLTLPTFPFALLHARGPVGEHVQGMHVYTSGESQGSGGHRHTSLLVLSVSAFVHAPTNVKNEKAFSAAVRGVGLRGVALTIFFAGRGFGGFERGEQGLVARLRVLLFEVLAHGPIFLCLLLSASPSMPVPWGTWALVSQRAPPRAC